MAAKTTGAGLDRLRQALKDGKPDNVYIYYGEVGICQDG